MFSEAELTKVTQLINSKLGVQTQNIMLRPYWFVASIYTKERIRRFGRFKSQMGEEGKVLNYLERMETWVNLREKGHSVNFFQDLCFLPEVGDDPVEIVREDCSKKNEKQENLKLTFGVWERWLSQGIVKLFS